MVTAAHDHPVVAAARSILKESDGKFVLDEQGAALLMFGIQKHVDDPALPAAIVALFELAALLAERGSDAAARTLLEVIRAVTPLIPSLNVLDEEMAANALGTAVSRTAPVIDAATPEGTVRVATLHQPRVRRP